MNYLRFGLALCSLLPVLASSQTFKKVAPLPTGADLSGVSFTSPTTGWVVGNQHSCYKTTDHGITWTAVNIPGSAGEPLYDVLFVTPQLGFISGNSAQTGADIYRTADGGATWQPVSGMPFGSWRQIDFVSGTTGFMGANGALARTTDGGLTWSGRSIYPDCPIVYGMDFVDANTGLVGGHQASTSKDGIFKTTDGGQTWKMTHAGSANDVVYLTNTTVLADYGAQILRSLDGGDTWFPIANVPTGISDLEKIGANTVVGVSTSGDIWRTTDGGISWSQRWVGEGDLPADWSLRFSDALNGHVVGQGGAIYETADGGVTWTRLNRGIGRDWNGIVAFSDSRIVLGGHHGYVQTTSDFGNHWDLKLLDAPTFGRDTNFSDVAKIDANTAMVVGHWGSLFKTSDQGQTWTNLSAGLDEDYYPNAITFTDQNNGWIAGFDYKVGPKRYVRRTTDGGLTWQVASLNVPSMDVEFVGQTGYVLTTSNPLHKTVDGGNTWNPITIQTPLGQPWTVMRMSWLTANLGFVCGFDGFLAKTTDGGATWSNVRPLQSNFVYLDVQAVSANEIWACGARQGGGNAIVIRSLDGGATWQTWSLPGQYTTPVRLTRTPSRLFVTGYAGETWRLDLGAAVTGTVTLGDYVGPVAGTTVTVQVRTAGTTQVLDTYTTTLSASGAFSVTTSRTGTFDVAISGPHWLRKVVRNVTFSSTGATGVNASLVNGDANSDNAVTLSDFAAIRAAFGSMPGDANWNANADFNGDGAVTLADFAIVRSRFGQQGDE